MLMRRNVHDVNCVACFLSLWERLGPASSPASDIAQIGYGCVEEVVVVVEKRLSPRSRIIRVDHGTCLM